MFRILLTQTIHIQNGPMVLVNQRMNQSRIRIIIRPADCAADRIVHAVHDEF